jgi:hypothetical protein
MGEIIKDEEFEKEQANMRKLEMENFIQFKDQTNKFREDERKYRLQQKLKQIEECENLQVNQKNFSLKFEQFYFKNIVLFFKK